MDLRMPLVEMLGVVPGMNEFRPTTPVIVMSAYADFDRVIDLQMRGIYYFDQPINFGIVARTIRALLS